MSLRSAMLLVAVSCVFNVSSLSVAQRPSRSFVWPLSRTSKQIAPLIATFGPHADSVSPDSYSFHRGIDIPIKEGSPVYAIADGVVRLAGSYEYYRSPVVQVRHYKNAVKSCDNGGCYYSNYMHLSEVAVAAGKSVQQGQLLGYTGTSPEGTPHLHFEIRNAGVWQHNCVHPLTVLPYPNRFGPKIKIDSLTSDQDKNGALAVTLSCPRSECDLSRVDVMVFDSGRKKAQRTYDMVTLNFNNTPRENPNALIHVRDLQNVVAQPHPIDDQQGCGLTLVFYDLPDIDLEKSYQVRVKAVDARGKSSDASSRLRAEAKDAKKVRANALAARG